MKSEYPIKYGYHKFVTSAVIVNYQGRPQDLGGGGQHFFFLILEFACREATRIARGFGGMLPREFFLKQCNLVRFRVHFDQICLYFIQKINILETRLLWGISHEEIFENML